MIFSKELYRDFESKTGRIFLEGAEPFKDAPKFWGEKLEFDSSKMDAARLGQEIQNRFGPAQYETILRDYVKTVYPAKGDTDVRELLIQSGAGKYRQAFEGQNGIYAAFTKAIEDLADAREETVKAVLAETQRNLGTLRERVEAMRNAVAAEPEVPEIPSIALPPSTLIVKEDIKEDQRSGEEWIAYKQAEEETTESFEEYHEAFLRAYMTPELYKSETGKEFRRNFALGIEGRIHFMFREGKASKESLEALNRDLKNNLKTYGGLDGQPGDLSLKDISKMLDHAKSLDRDFRVLINTGSDEQVLQALEKRRLLSPKAWVEALEATAEAMIRDVKQNGTEKAFTKQMNKYVDERNQRAKDKNKNNPPPFNPIDNFEDAQNFFVTELVFVRGQAGAAEAIKMLEEVNRAVNSEQMTILDGVKPASLTRLVFRERDLLLGRLNISKSPYHNAVTEFVRAESRQAREAILRDKSKRKLLFEAIKVIEQDYTPYFKKNSQGVPKKYSELTSNPDSAAPTAHDKLARVGALIMLAGEAKWLVTNFAGTEGLKKENLQDQFDKTEIVRQDKQAVYEPDVNFRYVHQKYKTNYVPMAMRSGMTGKELGLSLVKGLAAFTLFANTMEAVKDGKLEGLIENPYIYASIATLKGVDLYRKDPRMAGFLSASPGYRAEMIAAMRLNKLCEKRERKNVEKFIGTQSEWEVMPHIKPDKVKKLIEKAKTENRRDPRISKEALKDLVPYDVWVHMPDTLGMARERFYFYEKFLMAPVNTVQLQEHCNQWMQ